MDKLYQDAMQEHVKQLAEELMDINALITDQGALSAMAYRAAERNLQLLIEACIGIAKQRLKAQGKQVPSDARQAFQKLQGLGLDQSGIDWVPVVGMRNALVHDYLNMDPARVIAVIQSQKHKKLIDFALQQLTA